MSYRELCHKTAIDLRRLLDTREISCEELLDAHLEQIDAYNDRINAIVTLVPEHARERARALDGRLAKREDIGILGGLPIAHKDLTATAGIRTTLGSRVFEDHVPEHNALVIDRLLAAGAVTLGKTNTPELGAGSQTFNAVFGATRNPWQLDCTCGGSSGGAASALAARLMPIADGTDLGGSLRNPASFCNVVGFRPSAGRVPRYPELHAWQTLGVTGPMARTVDDCALLLSAMAGPDPKSPVSIETPGDVFRRALDRDFENVRVAFSADFGGQLPVADDVREALAGVPATLEQLGCRVDEACPDFAGADEAFKTLRAHTFAAGYGELLEHHRDTLKDTVVWNIEAGLALSGTDVARAETLRSRLYHRVREFMQDYEFLALPVSQVAPFDVDTEWVQEIDGQGMETYIDWMRSCYFISVTGLPAISVPCGFTDEGLPVGLQIVGRHHADFAVLQLAHAFDTASGLTREIPALLEI